MDMPLNTLIVNQDKEAKLLELYNKYVNDIIHLQDISKWCSKKTVTDKVLNAERTNEKRVFEAMEDSEDEYQEGDKIFVYFDKEGNLKLQETWKPESPDHDPFKLIEKLWKTVNVFSTVVDISKFPKYHLKRQRKLLENFNVEPQHKN